jgi:hypothetical protein
MKTQISILIFILICTQLSCNKSKKKDNATEKLDEIHSSEQQYLFAQNKDSIRLVLNVQNNQVYGTLDFLPYEKDGRQGSLYNVTYKGDTLFAWYRSIQEGETSDAEIAFLKKDNSLILTNDIYGESNYKYNSDYSKASFINKNLIKFDGDTLLKIEVK